MRKEFSTYIFDLDGTLIDSIGDLASSCNYALRKYGMGEYSVDEVRMMVGNGVNVRDNSWLLLYQLFP